MLTGIDKILLDVPLRRSLDGRRVALLAHPASMTSDFRHSLDALFATSLNMTAAFGPQHGMRGDKQDNMMETADDRDRSHDIPVFSLYGEVRRPTAAMLDTFDVLLVDIQDVGCRIYTFLTTVCYLLEDCARAGKSLWVLDRPNPAGREIEGGRLLHGFESFVGIGDLPMRHGFTLGEAALWYVAKQNLDLDLHVVACDGYDPGAAPGYGWPLGERPWVNPSPNIATLNAARCYPGTVLLEGTTLSEGRGTTRPLEMAGAPDIDISEILGEMKRLAADWMRGCLIRPCWFQPTFHKHENQLCSGFQIHTDWPGYQPGLFRPYRLIALFLKALRNLQPDYPVWRDFPYEYTSNRLPIDTIDGSERLRRWVDDAASQPDDLDQILKREEADWEMESAEFLLYPD